MATAGPLRAGGRLAALALALACLAVLLTAARLRPDPRGHDTHTQLGIPRCLWMARFERPCPTCGMTTSFAHMADGNTAAAFRTQPAGATAALACAAAFWGALHAAVRGARWDRVLSWLVRPAVLWAVGALFFLAWAYKLAGLDATLR